MASLSNHVTLTIAQNSVGVSRAGFGVPLILSATAAWSERVRFYSSLAEVATDFAVTTSAEYLAASAIFSQTPKPTSIAIGRSALKPTQVYTIIPIAANSRDYVIKVKGKGVTTTTVTFTSDASGTVAEAVAGIVTALNAVVGKNYTAVDTASTSVVVTATAAGDWFSLEVVDVTVMSIAQTHADPGVATDLTAIALETDAWYMLYTLYNSNAYVLAAAAYIEAVKKMYIADVSDSASVTAAVGGSDTLDDIATLTYTRTAGIYHPAPGDMNGAAWLGRVLPTDPGAATWKFKRLAGVNPTTLTSTYRTNLVAKNANFYETVAGINMMSEVTRADGDFIDVTRNLDWLDDDMRTSVFAALVGNDIIPFTDEGIAVIEAEIRGSLGRAVTRGVLTNNPAPVVSVPKAADVDSADKLDRLLPDLSWSATLAGAVHKTDIDGTVSV